MFDKLEAMTRRFRELDIIMSDPDLLRDQKKYREIVQERAHLEEVVDEFDRYRKLQEQLTATRGMLEKETDSDIIEMTEEECTLLETQMEGSLKALKTLLVPRDPNDGKNTILEIRAGTGGEEAALFAGNLFRMYTRYSERRGWKVEIMDSNPTELGGYKEIVFSVSGKDVYGSLRYESGVHRVQRVPTTEGGGRIHTSAVTVAVLPEAEETEIDLRPEDVRVDVFRSSGPGGQSVNTTDSAVRVTHIPTGMVVICQDEKSQLKNKAKALRILRARLFEAEDAKRRQERSDARKTQVGSGDRSERIRTYNFPQNRLTDHRINLTIYHLDTIMEGEIDEVIESLKLSAREEFLGSGGL